VDDIIFSHNPNEKTYINLFDVTRDNEQSKL